MRFLSRTIAVLLYVLVARREKVLVEGTARVHDAVVRFLAEPRNAVVSYLAKP